MKQIQWNNFFHSISNVFETFLKNFQLNNGEIIFYDDDENLFKTLKFFLKQNNFKKIVSFDNHLIKSIDGIEVLNNQIDKAEIGIFYCDFLIARTGSIVVSQKDFPYKAYFLVPNLLLICDNPEKLIEDFEYDFFAKKYGQRNLTLITGPSRTADIEKTLILGMHGPKRLILFVNKKRGFKAP